MTLAALLAAFISIGALWWSLGEMHLHMAIATFLGVFFTVELGTALMSLVFLSAGTGHDEQIEDPLHMDPDDPGNPDLP